ncbi:MAG: hypothetical protein ABSG13_24950 [Bryobacteraceae bacterium]|jgi:hypothetical protein
MIPFKLVRFLKAIGKLSDSMKMAAGQRKSASRRAPSSMVDRDFENVKRILSGFLAAAVQNNEPGTPANQALRINPILSVADVEVMLDGANQ